MKKSQMMLVVVMAICCFSCISSSAIITGIGGSVAPIVQFSYSRNQENDIQSAGNIREMVVKACNTCKQNNWEGTTRTVSGEVIPCSDIKEEECDEILRAASS
jgi:hypothetical protein